MWGKTNISLEAYGGAPLPSPQGSGLLPPGETCAVMASTCLLPVHYLGMEHLSALSATSRDPSLASNRISHLPYKTSVLRKNK